MSQSLNLYRLQQVDSQLDKARGRLKEIEAILKDDAVLRQAQAEQEAAAADLQEAEKDLRGAEQEVHAQQIKIEQNQAVLYGGSVKNPKELEDLQGEASALRRYLEVLEDRQLETMIAYEETEQALLEAQSRVDQVTAQRIEQHSDLTTEQEELNLEVEKLEIEHQAAAASVSEDAMRTYTKLRGSHGGLAVSKVQEQNCAACGSPIPAATMQAARSSSELTRCPTCGRILYT